jgi:hypothetical protein
VAYLHTLAAFVAGYLIVHYAADSHQQLFGLLTGLGMAVTVAIPYVIVIIALGLLREIAENTR